MVHDSSSDATKTCAACGQTLPRASFSRGNRRCKPCFAAHVRAKRLADPEGFRVARRARYATDQAFRARDNAASRAHYAANREARAAWGRAYYAANRGRILDRSRAYYEANRRAYIARAQARAAADLEASRAYRRGHYRTNVDRYIASSQRRRAREAAAFVADVDLWAIYERDGGRCHICGEVVPRRTGWPDGASPDHIVPLILGGTHEPSNVRLAHLQCNLRRGPGRIPAQMLLPLDD